MQLLHELAIQVILFILVVLGKPRQLTREGPPIVKGNAPGVRVRDVIGEAEVGCVTFHAHQQQSARVLDHAKGYVQMKGGQGDKFGRSGQPNKALQIDLKIGRIPCA